MPTSQNTIQIKRNVAGEAVAIQVKGLTEGYQSINETRPFYDFTLGDLAGGKSTLSFNQGDETRNFPFTLDTHADDNGIVGATAYRGLEKHLTHTEHPHGEISKNPSLGERINGALLSIANIFGRLESVEKALAMDTKPFHSWIVRKGREFQCEMENRENGIASVVLPNNYIAVSEKLNDDPNDTRELLRIKTSLGVLQIITARQELGAIQDALNADADEAVHSAVHKAVPETEDE